MTAGQANAGDRLVPDYDDIDDESGIDPEPSRLSCTVHSVWGAAPLMSPDFPAVRRCAVGANDRRQLDPSVGLATVAQPGVHNDPSILNP